VPPVPIALQGGRVCTALNLISCAFCVINMMLLTRAPLYY
jgi:hypothetical protein